MTPDYQGVKQSGIIGNKMTNGDNHSRLSELSENWQSRFSPMKELSSEGCTTDRHPCFRKGSQVDRTSHGLHLDLLTSEEIYLLLPKDPRAVHQRESIYRPRRHPTHTQRQKGKPVGKK